MVLSDEERKARRAEANRKWKEKNKERCAETNRIWRENNKEHRAEQNRAYRETPVGIKTRTISKWKSRGLIDSDGDNYEKRYQQYLEATHCNACKSEFKDSYNRKMDHNHETGLFRQFLCGACNGFDYWLKH